MGDPTPSDRLGIGRRFDDFGRRIRNLEKSIRRRLTVASLFASGDVNAAGNVTGSTVASYSGITGLFLTVALAVKGLTGEFTNGVKSPGVRTTTLTNSPVQLYVDADGNLGVSASTLAKKNIGTDYNVDMDKFLAVKLKNWTYKDKPFASGMGPIADDLDAAGLKEFVIYNLDGSIQGVRTDMLVVGLMSAYFQSRAITLAEFNKRSVQTKTITNMSALALGATQSYTVTWDTPFADTNYAVSTYVYSNKGVLLSGVTAASLPSSRTTTQCVVQVTAGVALLAGQTLVVEAIHV